MNLHPQALFAWLCTLLALCLFSPEAAAVAYTFPGNLPAGCTASGSTYTCGSLALGAGDTVSIAAPKPATVRINGTLDISNGATFNASGAASDVSLVISGALTLGYQSVIMGNVTAASISTNSNGLVIGGTLTATGSGSIQLLDCSSIGGAISSGTGPISVGQNCVVNGGISSTSGAIANGYLSQVKGSISSAGAISVGQASVVTGDVSSSGSTVDLAYQAQVSGNISASGRITLTQASIVGGNVTGSNNTISLGYQTQVGGNISSTGGISIGQSAVVGGKITGGSGAISFDFAAKVSGEVSSTTGSISFAQSSIAQACVRSSSSASISLGASASINSVCCGSSCGNSCVSNNTGFPMPPACMPTPVLDYHFDECSYKGSSGEVKDSRGNYPGTAQQGATTGGNSPLVIDRYADLSSSSGLRYITPNSFVPTGNSWTVSAWLKFPLNTSGGSPYHILAAVDGGGDLIFIDGTSNYVWGSYNNNTITRGSFRFSSLSSGWHHVAATGSGGVTTLYIDGAFKESVNSQTKGNLAFVGASWDIDSGTHESINTLMDEFMLFNSVLSASNISSLYNNQKAGSNYDGSARTPSACVATVASFVVSSTASASTCSPKSFSITAKDASGNTITGYTGTVNLSTSTNRGDFSSGSPSPAGTLTPGTANTGRASYSFAAGDAGVVNLQLTHGLAQNLTISVQDSSLSAAVGSSGTIQFRDTAFIWSEDLNNKISGSNIVVAGRNHDLQVALWKKDSVTGNCAIASDYNGSRNLKLWRTDSGGPWTAPAISSPALTIPAARPASNNLLNTNFSNGVASLSLTTSDIGKYALSLDDDSLLYAATTISGGLGPLTVRPFALVVSGLSLGGVSNPAGSQASDAKFGAAGASFSATLGAYRWSSTADAGSDGQVDSGASLAQVTAGGLAPSYSSAIALSPLSGSQTPSIGVLGSLSNSSGSNPSIGGFSGGQVTVSDLKYSEVGSFALNTSGVVQNFLGTAGLNLDATVFAGTAQNNRVGRFVPAGFVASNAQLTHRQAASCSPASVFSYLGEDFKIAFTLTAQNAQGATTQNYTDVFAKQDLSVLNLAGIQGSTPFKTGGRLVSSSSGTWSLGQASPILIARVSRASTPDGPFASANFGIAPVDADSVGMRSFDLDTDSPANGNDRSALKTAAAPLLAMPVSLRFGQLRLQNAIGPATRDLYLPLQAQYWNGTNFITNTDDSCTSIDSKTVNFGNYRKTLAVGDGSLISKTYQLNKGTTSLGLSRPGGGRSGSLDVALSLNTLSDQSCLQTWSPSPAATATASLAYLQGAWCGANPPSYVKDPSARATFGLFRGSDSLIYQRENY